MYVYHVVMIAAICLVLFSGAGKSAYAAQSDPEQWKRTDFEGIEVWYQDLGNPDGPPLVFIHGVSCNTSVWRHQVPAFSNEYRLILLDLPGFGRSGKPYDVDYTMAYMARAVRAVVTDAGAEQPVLIGHSMGFSVSRQYLIDYPGTVRAIVNLDGAYFRIPPTIMLRTAFENQADVLISEMRGPNRKEAARAFVTSTFYGKTPSHIREEVMEIMTTSDWYASTSALREMMRLDQWRERRFTLPALVIYARSPYLFISHEPYMRRTFPHLVFEEWRDTGHYLMMEKPDRLNASLRNFLRTVETVSR